VVDPDGLDAYGEEKGADVWTRRKTTITLRMRPLMMKPMTKLPMRMNLQRLRMIYLCLNPSNTA